MSNTILADGFRNWAKLCVAALANSRNEIDSLNVFPVPDGDTGTNSYLTFETANQALAEAPATEEVSGLMKVFGDQLLISAKGNSGVILSELVRGSLRVLQRSPLIRTDVIAEAFTAAADAAYAAVGEPVEGTILSVARAAAVGAGQARTQNFGPAETVEAAAEAARKALINTPQQMQLLADAGVIDAGGRALVVVLDATVQALTGRSPEPMPAPVVTNLIQPAADLVAEGPAYEVMYLLDAESDSVATLKLQLAALGDSLVVVGGDRLWNVHVHVDDVGAAIEAGLEAGRPYRIAVTHFAEQIRRQKAPAPTRAVLAAVTGPGIAALVEESGAICLPFAPGQFLPIELIERTLNSLDAAEIIVLPNREAHIHQFEAAAQMARHRGVRVAVIPTTVQVQGLAALAVHDDGRAFEDDVIAMSTAAGHVKHGAVTVATEAGMTMAGPCKQGDVLGVVNGDFAIVGQDTEQVAIEVLQRLDSVSAELVTLVQGVGFDHTVVDSVELFMRRVQPHVEVVVYQGEQEKYGLFIAVE